MPDTGTAPATSTSAATALPSRGIHHLALTTEDMQMTTDFFVNVVGMPLVHAMKVPPGVGTGPGNRGNPPYEEIRHYFFDMGNDSLLAYFEIPKGEKKQSDRDDIGGHDDRIRVFDSDGVGPHASTGLVVPIEHNELCFDDLVFARKDSIKHRCVGRTQGLVVGQP